MGESNKFPLVTGQLSLDLVNTEVVRRGQRLDLFTTETDVLEWIDVLVEKSEWISKPIKENAILHSAHVMEQLLQLRAYLRKKYEEIADGKPIALSMIAYLEEVIAGAPFTYRMVDGVVVPIPVGDGSQQLQSLIAFDALKLIEQGKLSALKRCSNSDCVLLFIDETGRRKWCSMKICGNRHKVARFQQQHSANA